MRDDEVTMRALPLLLVLSACGASEPEAPPPAPPAEVDEAAVLEEVEAAARALGGTLRTRVEEAMGEGGPPEAMRVCSEEAQALTAGVAGETGVRVGRSSLRLRNPTNAPEPWVATWLTGHGDAPAEEALPHRAVETGVARVVLPIPMEAPCMACHGPSEQISDEVQALLAERYPEDEATGYAVGDLRGALWAEKTLTP